MKYLYDHDDLIRHLHVWAGKAPLVKACFYFWNPGQHMQKSLEGLLQTLLYHILHTCPDLAPAICPKRWNEGSQPHSIDSTTSWTLHELQKSFESFKRMPSVATKFYFHVDGLDEYYGDSWDVVEILRDLSTAPNVKLCVSSRPWNCFQDAFGRANPHMLRLHDLTRQDIELFARENLVSFGLYADFESTLFDDLVQDIGDRAQGVFLWVRLVVRSLRDGIINDDPITILQERLRAIPSDLEKFFEQILGSVEEIYRTRMASTFLTALRSHHPLKMIHYYFLEQGDTTFGFDHPSKIWKHSQIQKRVIQTERRLNGRFKGLLEPASTVGIDCQTKVDFLHRTLRDFLATERMRNRLQSWASQELNVFTAMSRALIAESKFIDKSPSPSTLKLAVELASQGAIETSNTDHCYEVIGQAELENERIRPNHSRCGLNCYMIRFAASIGHTDYLRSRLHKDISTLDPNRILKHMIYIAVHPGETYDLSLPSRLTHYGTPGQPKDWFVPSFSGAIGNAPLPSLVLLLLGFGADPNAIVDGESSWCAFAGEVIKLMDSEQKEQGWAVLEIFLEKDVDVNTVTDKWIEMLKRMDAASEDSLRNTLKYFRRLFTHGLDPNAVSQSTTLTQAFLRTLAQSSLGLSTTAQAIQCELLREFLRYGADVSQVYRDRTTHGWLKNVSQELHHQCTLTCLSPRTTEYRMLLEHGLDPNAILHSGHTVWEHLLGAMHRGIQQSSYRSHHQTIRYMVLASLQYGANPHVDKLRVILLWMGSSSSLLSDTEIDDVDRVFRREVDQTDSRTRSRIPFEARQVVRSGLEAVNSLDVWPGGVCGRSRQDQKRNHGQTPYRGHDFPSKRVRFS
jgi:hypothetical protein